HLLPPQLPPPPPSPPFPYTTLFRSRHPRHAREPDHQEAELDAGPGSSRLGGTFCGDWHTGPGAQTARKVLGVVSRVRAAGPPPLDRKSTRLNSSHVSISYAVFCLKK